MPSAKMLMIVPLMIWSARTVIDSQAWSGRDEQAAAMAATSPISERRGWPRRRERVRRADGLGDEGRDQEGRERGGQHHALDADVHHARALVHEPAQGAQGDRGRQRPR